MAAEPRSDWVAGVDACRRGWVVVQRNLQSGEIRVEVVSTFALVLAREERPAVLAVDIPIGLASVAETGGREVDRVARSHLRGKKSSVFSAPSHAALASFRAGGSHEEVSRANRESGPDGVGVSLQAYRILRRIAEVDEHMTADLQSRVIEVHPELCFAEANGGSAITSPKKKREGRDARVRVLAAVGLLESASAVPRCPGAAVDDVLDAFISSWTAERVGCGRAIRIPQEPPVDDRGLRMEIWR